MLLAGTAPCDVTIVPARIGVYAVLAVANLKAHSVFMGIAGARPSRGSQSAHEPFADATAVWPHESPPPTSAMQLHIRHAKSVSVVLRYAIVRMSLTIDEVDGNLSA